MIEQQSARIADVLHDESSQLLASAHLALEDAASDASAPVSARLRQARQYLDTVAEQLRRISHELHPSIVDDLGAIDAVQFASRTFAQHTGIPVSIALQWKKPCSAAVGDVVYRLVQTSLANVRDHARASAASITIARERSCILCTIVDDGIGFDVAAALAPGPKHGLGLRLIRARIEALGGTLAITSSRQGTRLCAVIPAED